MRRILVVGIDHVIGKLLYFYEDMTKRHGLDVFYVTADSSGISSQYVNDAQILIGNCLQRGLILLRQIIFKRPAHVEIYLARLFDVLVGAGWRAMG